MGKRATEPTVGITHFLSESDTSFSGVLKQRYSDFIVHEIDPDGEVCRGTDFPGLLWPIDHSRPDRRPNAPRQHPTTAPPAETSAVAETGVTEEGEGERGAAGQAVVSGAGGPEEVKGEKEGGTKEATHNSVSEEQDKGAKKNDEEARKMEEEARKKEEEEETKPLVKSGAQTLLPVLGEEVTAKVEAFVLEGICVRGRDKRTLTLPSSDKTTRTLIYNLLKKNLSRYLLAETVDEPAVVPPASVETPEATSDGASPTSADAPSAESGDKVDAPSCNGTDAVAADAAKPSSASAQEKSSGENGGEKGGDEAKKVEAVVKTDPNGPKCVQLKMKPDWRKGSNKRRRGDLAGGEGRWAWPADRPEFCRFVLYKENSDTMGAVSRMAKHFRFSGKIVGYAGTKDKRGVTSQWCTVKRKSIQELRTFNRPLGSFQGPIVLLGNFSYVSEPLKLGNLSGNRFGIVLRNLTLPGDESTGGVHQISDNSAEGCAATEGGVPMDGDGKSQEELEETILEKGVKLRETIDLRCAWVRERGFINYFGLQRFGSGGAPTSEVGLAMLKEDWEGAVRLIMTPRMGENEATHDSKVHYLKNPTDIQGTLNKLPYFMDAEKSMMLALIRGGPKAYVEALKAVPKNLQLMYLHAFQSLVWNLAASERVKLYGWEGAVEGDLVFPKNASASSPDAMLAEPEVLIDAQEEASPGVGEDRGAGEEAAAGDSLEKREVKRAKTVRAPLPEVHVVTKEDVESGVFRLSDVVLPMPGSGVSYPTNGVKECYTKALEDRGLTEECFSSSSQKAFSLGGTYRRLVQIPKDLEWEVKRYDDHTLHLINTDIDDLLDVDDARIAAEQKEMQAREEAAAAASAAAATATAATGDGKTDLAQAPIPTEPLASMEAEPLASKEATPVAPESKEGQTARDAMNVEVPPGAEEQEGGAKPARPLGRYYALCLHFTLPSAAYATMCLREITKQDTSTSFHTSLNALAPGQHPGKEGAAAAASSEEADAVASVGKGGAIEEGDKAEAKSLPPKGAVIKIGASLRT